MKTTERDRQLASRLEHFCLQNNLNQKEAAAKCDITQQDFNKLINLKKCFTLLVIQKIIVGLGFYDLTKDLALSAEEVKANDQIMEKLNSIEEIFRLVQLHHGNDILLLEARQSFEIKKLELMVKALTQAIKKNPPLKEEEGK